MPLHSDQNLYPGINPHLNSIIQKESGEWESFHNDHITNIREHLDATLPPGYLARTEKSLQISEIPLLPGSRTAEHDRM